MVIAPANVDKGAGRDVDRIFGFEGPARNWFGSLGDRSEGSRGYLFGA